MLREAFESVNESKDPVEEYLKGIGKEKVIPKIKSINDKMKADMDAIVKKANGNPLEFGPEIEAYAAKNVPKALAKIKSLGITDEQLDAIMALEKGK
jgi:hypothetical protein